MQPEMLHKRIKTNTQENFYTGFVNWIDHRGSY